MTQSLPYYPSTYIYCIYPIINSSNNQQLLDHVSSCTIHLWSHCPQCLQCSQLFLEYRLISYQYTPYTLLLLVLRLNPLSLESWTILQQLCSCLIHPWPTHRHYKNLWSFSHLQTEPLLNTKPPPFLQISVY